LPADNFYQNRSLLERLGTEPRVLHLGVNEFKAPQPTGIARIDMTMVTPIVTKKLHV
jgi:hypothetical protein